MAKRQLRLLELELKVEHRKVRLLEVQQKVAEVERLLHPPVLVMPDSPPPETAQWEPPPGPLMVLPEQELEEIPPAEQQLRDLLQQRLHPSSPS